MSLTLICTHQTLCKHSLQIHLSIPPGPFKDAWYLFKTLLDDESIHAIAKHLCRTRNMATNMTVYAAQHKPNRSAFPGHYFHSKLKLQILNTRVYQSIESYFYWLKPCGVLNNQTRFDICLGSRCHDRSFGHTSVANALQLWDIILLHLSDYPLTRLPSPRTRETP